MTLKEIRERVAEIDGMGDDPEVAHSFEDSLYHDFVDFIADAGGEYADLAIELRKVRDISFPRWMA